MKEKNGEYLDEIISGILYIRHDNQAGPQVRAFIPEDLSIDLIYKTPIKSLSILAGEEGKIPNLL